MIIVFILVILAIVCGIHAYLWIRLVRNTTRRSSRGRTMGTTALAALAALLVATMIGSEALPRSAEGVLAWPGFIWLATMFYLLATLLALEVPAAVARWVMRGRGAMRPVPTRPVPTRPPDATPDTAPADPGRRLFVARSVAITASLAATGAVGTGMAAALGSPLRKRISVPLAKLPKRLDRFRIALVSDIHLGPILGAGTAERVVDVTNGYDADVIAVVGDVVDGDVGDLRTAVEPLRHLRSRHGTYFVTGNHEYYSDAGAWVECFSSLGMRALRNDLVSLGGIDLAGVEDVSAGPDYDKALAGHDRSIPVVLLAHQPIQAHEAAKRGVDLQLSGHTHDGQMWPFSLIVGMVQPLRAGLGTVDGMPVYVTRGAGFWGPPVRFGAPPDISLIELRSA